MKKILFLLSLFILIPSYSNPAQAVPMHNAPASTWFRWFKNLRKPTRKDLLIIRQYLQSQWRCVTGHTKCSKRKKQTLQALTAAIAVGTIATIGYKAKSLINSGYKAKSIDPKKRTDLRNAISAARLAAQANQGAKKFSSAQSNTPAQNATNSPQSLMSANEAWKVLGEMRRILEDRERVINAEIKAWDKLAKVFPQLSDYASALKSFQFDRQIPESDRRKLLDDAATFYTKNRKTDVLFNAIKELIDYRGDTHDGEAWTNLADLMEKSIPH